MPQTTPPPGRTKSAAMTFRFDPETAAQLRALAEETGRKQVTIVERAIAAAFRDYFGRRGADVVPPRRRDG